MDAGTLTYKCIDRDPFELFAAGGKPSTRLPPGELIDQLSSSQRTEPTNDKARHNPKTYLKIHILDPKQMLRPGCVCVPGAQPDMPLGRYSSVCIYIIA